MKLVTTMSWLAVVAMLGLGATACGDSSKSTNSSAKGGAGGGAATEGGGGATDGGASGGTAGSSGGASSVDGACTSEEEAQAPTLFEPDNENIQYTGRIDFTDPKAPKFSVGGVTISTKFRGSALTVHLKDQNNYNYFDVIIDGTRVVNTTKIASFSLDPLVNTTTYEIPVAGGCKEHSLELVKRTEAAIGSSTFLGFEVAKLVAPDPLPTRRIEVIGDSITAGAGVEGENGDTVSCPNGGSDWGLATNAHLAWGTLLAQTVKAQVHTMGVSGIGLIRNYSSQWDARPMPEVYNLLYPESKTSVTWDTSKYVPDAIVLALGTNDFSPGDSPAATPREHMTVDAFTAAYIAFIDKLHGYYPNAKFFLSGSPMLGDGWPDATYTSKSDHITSLKAIAEHYATTDVSVTYAPVTKLAGLGCGTHPNSEQQAYTAKEIAKVVQPAMGW